MKKYMNFLIFVTLISVLGCENKEGVDAETKDSTYLNSFSMNLNGELWEPSLINNNSCYSTFECAKSEYINNTYYTIKAYKDPESKTTAESENMLRIQIADVDSIGVYNISDTVGAINSYAFFLINESDTHKTYENSTSKGNSTVIIDEFLPKSNSNLIGIKGSFSGILYNIDNPNDSVVIDNCRFTFNKINISNYCHCDEY